MEDEARFHALCERLRACWSGQGRTFTFPPATEQQVRASEAQLGFSLPPLLRLLYREVANGGAGLVWYDEEFPFVGAQAGIHSHSSVGSTPASGDRARRLGISSAGAGGDFTLALRTLSGAIPTAMCSATNHLTGSSRSPLRALARRSLTLCQSASI